MHKLITKLFSPGLKVKMILLASGIVVLSISPVSLLVLWQNERVITEKTLEVCKNMAQNIANFATEELLINETYDSTQTSIYRLKELNVNALNDAYVLNVEGQIIADMNKTRLNTFASEKLINEVQNISNLSLSEFSNENKKVNLRFIYPIFMSYGEKNMKLGAAVFEFDKKLVYAPINKIRDTIILTSVIVFSFAVIIGIIAAIVLTRPILQLSKGANIIGGGNLNHRIKVQSSDEIGELAFSFNDMTAKIQDLMNNLEQKVIERTIELKQEKEKSESLLLNILPMKISEELKENGHVESRLYHSTSILFTDFKGFTKVAEIMDPKELLMELERCFIKFDEITERHTLEKLKTIGDAYMCAGGIPEENNSHPIDTCVAGLQMQNFMEEKKRIKILNEEPYWEMRLGIHTGQIMAGVIGRKKFAYDIWGDTVNTASRMESSGEPGKVNISETTYSYIKEFFECEYRGKIPAKNKAPIGMYFVNRIKKEYSKDELGVEPNDKFYEQRKKIINQKIQISIPQVDPEIQQVKIQSSETLDYFIHTSTQKKDKSQESKSKKKL
ncbi:MAG: HAMP domain-containing protein [Leptospiraceae bacterium]|nr:HAMP domain-containing protein [Leptospiraceae bacterium]MCK6379688.1 HAMP domain-containing protein [Leptospiraceae bacterium]NUM41579.1 HAMP domain-containing protein [Leptospiraceae bacterium]